MVDLAVLALIRLGSGPSVAAGFPAESADLRNCYCKQ